MPQAPELLNPAAYTADEGIVFYDLEFEIDPEAGEFRSTQMVTLTGNLVEGRKLSFFIGDGLVVDQLALQDEEGNELAVTKWEQVDTHSTAYWWGEFEVAEIEILAEEELPMEENLVLVLEYHLPPEAIQDGLAENMYELFVSPQSSHAGGPESGAFPLVEGSLEAPFTLAVRHPDGLQCAMPGERVGEKRSGGYSTVTYQSSIPYDPSFSCAPYTVMRDEVEGIQIEIFSPAHLDLSPDMLETIADTLSLYVETFGKPQAGSFRIVFPDLENEKGGGESNGNIIFLGDIQPFVDYDEEARDIFTHLVAHEGYHLWNAWGLNWEGELVEWWVEGGANFMASWAKERLMGVEAGASNRQRHLEGFIEQEAYLHKSSLDSLDDSWFDDWALVYDYGALVWEQLRQTMGTDAFLAGLLDFYALHGGQTVTYEDFVDCMQNHTEADVAAAVAQWTIRNAQVDLRIDDVAVQQVDEGYAVQVDLGIEADGTIEIFSALGYRAFPDETWQLIDLRLKSDGRYSVKFVSEEKPLEIQIDPLFRVPQIELDNNIWIVE